MGLDMYLTAEKSLFSSEYHSNPLADAINNAVAKQLKKERSTFPVGTINNGIGGAIKLCAAYWRKANAVHGWFVQNVQNGNDDCGTYYVSREQLLELQKLCRGVLDGSIKKEDLPPTEGFFFGSVTDDEWYRSDLQDTVDQIDVALKLPKDWEFEYHSSW